MSKFPSHIRSDFTLLSFSQAQQLNYSDVLRNSPLGSVVQYGLEISRCLKDGFDNAPETVQDLCGAS